MQGLAGRGRVGAPGGRRQGSAGGWLRHGNGPTPLPASLPCSTSRPFSGLEKQAAAHASAPSTSASRLTSESSSHRHPTATCSATEDASCRSQAHAELEQSSATTSYHGAGSACLGLVAALTSWSLLNPPLGLCSEALSGSSLNVLQNFLSYVESLGAAGPWAVVLTVMLFEMVPLFPTQPLSIASGLLFGPLKGTLVVMLGGTLAATNAFLISRGVGRKLAEKVIVMEMSEDHGAVASKLAQVQHAIRSGGFWQQLTAVILLRLTPVVPFSASNYVLGLTPVQMPAYIAGTVIGISVWSLLYASLGGASRQLLDGGMDLGTLFADLADRAGSYSSIALTITLGLGVAAGVVYAARQLSGNQPAVAPEQTAAETEEQRGDSDLEEVPLLKQEATAHK